MADQGYASSSLQSVMFLFALIVSFWYWKA